MQPLKKFVLRPGKRIAMAAAYYFYDCARYLKHSCTFSFSTPEGRDYQIVKIYHRLEKSLSFRHAKDDSGWGAANELYNFIKDRDFDKEKPSFHESAGLKVLNDFISSKHEIPKNSQGLLEFIRKNSTHSSEVGGVEVVDAGYLTSGTLDDPESFFQSRHSVRDFSSDEVDPAVIKRALSIAMKTPSVCSRQAWHVYHLDERSNIDTALSFQNGNKGFGHEIPCLLLVTVDLRAFDNLQERYQGWIDGGMFSMSLILALHSLGYSSCCLNWSKGVVDDINIRKKMSISANHNLVMMIAVGKPKSLIKVCASARRPLDQIYTYIS